MNRKVYIVYYVYTVVTGVTLAIFYSKHARERMVLRGISTKEIEDAIKMGSKQIQKPDKLLSNYRYFCVVYKRIGENTYIITVKPR